MNILTHPRTLWGACLLLPLIVFGAVWANTHHMAQQGEDWLIPVDGYDPRDLLRGHFVQYSYDWPAERRVQSEDGSSYDFDPASQQALCIEGVAPNIRRATAFDSSMKQRCAIVVRATLGTRREIQGLSTGILYASQERALALQDKMRDPKLQGLIKVRIRPDGVMRPIDMAFRPRPPAPVPVTAP